MKPQQTKRKTSFRLRDIKIEWLSVDTESAAGHVIFKGQAPLSDDWVWLVVSVTNKHGARFEVQRHLMLHDGTIGEATSMAKLLGQVSWSDGDENSTCPLCHQPGHGAAVCPHAEGF